MDTLLALRDYIQLFAASRRIVILTILAALNIPLARFIGSRLTRRSVVAYLVGNAACATTTLVLWLAVHGPVWAPTVVLTLLSTLIYLWYLIRGPKAPFNADSGRAGERRPYERFDTRLHRR